MRRVVVTGIGVLAPNGRTADQFWRACRDGISGIGPITRFDASGLPARIGGEIPDFDVRPFVKDAKSLKVMGRHVHLAVAAAFEAMHDAGLAGGTADPSRFGVCMGSGVIPMDMGELAPLVMQSTDEAGKFDPAAFGRVASNSLFPLWLLKHLPNLLSSHLAIIHGAEGPCNTITTACAAGTQAIGEAFRLIARDDADIMIAGGADSRLDPLMMAAYSSLGALSRSTRDPAEVSRPFDRDRDGFVLGEGSAVLILEEHERAVQRGAKIYSEVIGYGSSCDAIGLTKPDPKGIGASRAMNAALREAKLNRDEIDYINAHGTSTRLNDEMETAAVKTALGPDSSRVPLSSIKSMIGHLIGAAGAVEAAATALSIHTGIVPPTINLTTPDPTCDLDYVPRQARTYRIRRAMNNSFGFGGQNAALIMASV
jgi:3-oxoacyl-[acyl-carrier-protein] synthase II